MYLCVCVSATFWTEPALAMAAGTYRSVHGRDVHVPPPSLSFPLSQLLPLFLSLLPPSFCLLSPSSLPSPFCFSKSLILSSFHFYFSSVGKIIDQLTDLGQAGRGCSASCRACLGEGGGGPVLPGHRSPDDRLQWWGGGPGNQWGVHVHKVGWGPTEGNILSCCVSDTPGLHVLFPFASFRLLFHLYTLRVPVSSLVFLFAPPFLFLPKPRQEITDSPPLKSY